MTTLWRQGELLTLAIVDLSDQGDGVGRWSEPEDGTASRVVFVSDTAPGDRVLVRLLWVKPSYAHAQLVQVIDPSPDRQRPPCIVADKCGGCQWQHLTYEAQRQAKYNQVVQALQRIGQFPQPPVDPLLPNDRFFNYRNKVTYPLGRSSTGQVQAGYYRKGSHQLINLNQCPIQDDRFDGLLPELKTDIQNRRWSIYNEEQHRGALRHLSLRVGRGTGEILLTLVSHDRVLPGLAEQAQIWHDRYPNLVGVCVNYNPDRSNVIFGRETDCITGRSYLEDTWLGLRLRLRPDTFFQVHQEQAEAIVRLILEELNLQGSETIVDAYCGIGTLTLPLAKQLAQVSENLAPENQVPENSVEKAPVGRVWGIESQAEAVVQAQENARLNGLTNVEFLAGTVEMLLPKLTEIPTIVVLDPPRKGCDRSVIETLLKFQPDRIVYMSCNPATLARDLQLLCHAQTYHLQRVQPADFFPQTAHVESVAFLKKNP